MATKTTSWIRGLWGASERDVWAWGDENTVLHWDGQSWTPRGDGLTDSVDWIGGAAPGHIYAVGDFGLARYSNARWKVEVATEMLGDDYHDFISVCATDHHIVVGDAGGHALVRPR